MNRTQQRTILASEGAQGVAKAKALEEQQPRIFAIGDIHGHRQELVALKEKIIEEARYDPWKDDLVILGDLVDAGPDSKGVIEYLMEWQRMFPETVHILKGNHDNMMVDALKYECKQYQKDWWLFDSGYADKTFASYGKKNYETDGIPQEHLDWLDALPIYWETDAYFFCHAGVPPAPLSEIVANLKSENPDPELQEHLIWIRGDFYNSSFEWEKKIIFAHTPFPEYKGPGDTQFEPMIKDTMIGINTMPRDEGKLTCIELPSERFYFQKRL